MGPSRSRNSRDMARGSVEGRAADGKGAALRVAAQRSLGATGKVDGSEAKSSSSKQAGQKGGVAGRLGAALGGLGGLLGGTAGAPQDPGDTRTA